MNELAAAKGQATEPPRIKKFRSELIKAIPRFPNNRASLLHMRQKHLPELLIDYVNWRSRVYRSPSAHRVYRTRRAKRSTLVGQRRRRNGLS
jgi:hypothetical protein